MNCPQTMVLTEFNHSIEQTPAKKELKAIYGFMANVFPGNYSWRYKETSFMEKASKEGKRESVLGHQYSCWLLHSLYMENFPNLKSAINSERAASLLITHDLGEIPNGDISMTILLEQKIDKREKERQDLEQLTTHLPKEYKQQLLENYDSFELNKEKIEKINDKDVLFAKIVDSIEGDLFVIVNGEYLEKNSKEKIAEIVQVRMDACVQRLLEIFKQEEKIAAVKDLITIVKYHLNAWEKSGVSIELDSINSFNL